MRSSFLSPTTDINKSYQFMEQGQMNNTEGIACLKVFPILKGILVKNGIITTAIRCIQQIYDPNPRSEEVYH